MPPTGWRITHADVAVAANQPARPEEGPQRGRASARKQAERGRMQAWEAASPRGLADFLAESPGRLHIAAPAEGNLAVILPPQADACNPGKSPDAVRRPWRQARPVLHRNSHEVAFAKAHRTRRASFDEGWASDWRSCWRARARADITVPIGRAVISAISL